jgi:hypothetical protein
MVRAPQAGLEVTAWDPTPTDSKAFLMALATEDARAFVLSMIAIMVGPAPLIAAPSALASKAASLTSA